MQIIIVYALLYLVTASYAVTIARRVYNRKFSLQTVSRSLILTALVSLVIAGLVGTYNDSMSANFFQHAVGGGVVSGLLCIALLQGFKLQVSQFSLLIIIVATVSTLGVMNELLEYFFQSTTPLMFSYDATDTWRDLLANTSGALAAWFVGIVFFSSKR